MPQFFIDRPVFAWVLAILITLGGALTIFNLPVESYPSIAPPQININTTYPGADAQTIESSVTQPIEQQLVGIDHLLYFTSTSYSNGTAQTTLTFENGTNPDIAAVQTQNRVTLAQPRLPAEVVQQGITIAKANAGFLMAVALRSEDGTLDSGALDNIIASRVLEPLGRIQGVGFVQHFGSEYAMRIWLNPDKLRGFGLSAATVLDRVREQNVQLAAGAIGSQPANPGQPFTASAIGESRFSTPEQFENVILRALPNGTTVRLKDVAQVTLGPYQYGRETRLDNRPVAACAIQLLPGANALAVAKAIRAKMADLALTFPRGVTWFVPYDSTTFIKVSIKEVALTLVAAIVLVFLVMLVFLQNLRATLIPTLVVPAALMGAFIGMYASGFSINQLSLFGMVLAIGIVVDDAIVVIENVERIMREEHLPPKEATRKAMGQITSAIVAITLVLAAVFIPSALQTGSAGAVYRQFALTIAISMLFSAFLALSFTPALCASLLKPTHLKSNAVFRWFNRAYDRSQNAYVRRVTAALHHTPRWMMGFAVLVLVGGFLFTRLPSSFLPEEDQGYAFGIVQLPPGATLERTMKVLSQVNAVLKKNEAVEAVMQVGGFSFVGLGENIGLAFVRLKPWDRRKTTSAQLIQWANGAIGKAIPDAQVFMVNLPTVRGLGAFGGFDFYLEDRSGQGHDALMAAQRTLLQKASLSPAIAGARANTLPDAPRLDMTLDRVQAQSMGLSVDDAYTAIQLMLAPVYVNDFLHGGRILRVLMQADAPFRMSPDALAHFYISATQAVPATGATATRAADAATPPMIPLSAVMRTQWHVASPALTRYNGFAAQEINGVNAPGHSSGEAMQFLESTVRGSLPAGFGFDWAGQSLQELLSGAEAPMLFLLSILAVYLCLAALYESWATPVAVMLVVPVGVFGAIVAAMLRGLPNDVFFKVGLITIIGLAAKNAILIVEFAVTAQAGGKRLREAVLEAARLRLRPILMTSFAFILGVLPLVLSTGAGANARHAIGTGVTGGMIAAALLGVLLVPVFYVAVRRLLGDKLDRP